MKSTSDSNQVTSFDNPEFLSVLIGKLLKEPVIVDGLLDPNPVYVTWTGAEREAYDAAETLILLTGRDSDSLILEHLPEEVTRAPEYHLRLDYLCDDRATQATWSKWLQSVKGTIHWDPNAKYPLDGKQHFRRKYQGRFAW